MHAREARLTTNTARLAQLMLPKCEIHLRGLAHQKVDTSSLDSSSQELLLLYPSDDAQELNADFAASLQKPVTLIVPDGSWRQASKVASRELAGVTCKQVTLPRGPESKYRLRSEPKPGGLATFEAIARAIGLIESPPAQIQMEALFQLMVDRTLASRGEKVLSAYDTSSKINQPKGPSMSTKKNTGLTHQNE